MEWLDAGLKIAGSLSTLACSFIWMLCCWICWKVHKSTCSRIEMYEKLVIDTAGRLAQLEFKFLMAKIHGDIPTTKEQQNDTSN